MKERSIRNSGNRTVVREATTLSSLEELRLSSSTFNHLQQMLTKKDPLTNQNYTLKDIVKKGRDIAYRTDCNTTGTPSLSQRWKTDLETSLRERGFIRPASDFNVTFNVIYIYHLAYGNRVKVMEMHDLSNEAYEAFEGLSVTDIEKVKAALKDRLDSREYDVMYYYFGLDGAPRRSNMDVTKHFGWPNKRIAEEITKRAHDKIRWHIDLPIMFGIPEDINQPDELYQLGVTLDDYKALTAAKISSVSDILAYADGERKNFNAIIDHRCMKNVEEKMHEAGYKDFNFPTLKRSAQLSAQLRAK